MSAPVFEAPGVVLYHGDCLEVMRGLPDASVHAVVTDPPYALEFMGRGWDKYTPLEFELWVSEWAREAYRVLKPGGHMLAFGGSRTWHRLAAGIEDAGFEIRDSIAWLYGSGFPKSLDVSKAIDKARDDSAAIHAVTSFVAASRDRAGVTNRQIDEHFGFNGMAAHWTNTKGPQAAVPRWEQWQALRDLLAFGDQFDAEVWRLNGRKGTPGEAWQTAEVLAVDSRFNEASGIVNVGQGERVRVDRQIKAANSDEAKEWEGWGTALKPAFEPIVVARKPLVGTVAGNVLAHGTGALNIDASRIAAEPGDVASVKGTKRSGGIMGESAPREEASVPHDAGRWPTNVVLDESQASELDRQTGILTSGANPTRRGVDGERTAYGEFKGQANVTPARGAESGGASRFFPTFRYEAKAPTAERPKAGEVQHPTVKPLDLMRWLVRLVTPKGGTILEPFAGSGTTLEAALLEGFNVIGIEREADYLPLIEARITKPLQVAMFGDWDEEAS